MKKLFFIPILLLACMGMRATDVSNFSGLSAALLASGTDDVTLTSDITLTDNITINGTKTIDFGTYTVTAGSYALTVASGATATFTGTTGGIKKSVSGGSATIAISGTAVFNGGNYIAAGNQSLICNANSNTTINGGFIEGGARSVFMYQNAQLTVTGGTIQAVTQGILTSNNGQQISISGGLIRATSVGNSNAVAIQHLNAGSLSISGSAILEGKNCIALTSASLSITGGSFSGSVRSLDLRTYTATPSSLSISGGTFVGPIEVSSELKSSIITNGGFISGGVWDTNVMFYCATAYEALLEDCEVHVLPAKTPAVVIKGKKTYYYKPESIPGPSDNFYTYEYEALFAALSNLTEGDTLSLLVPVTVPEDVLYEGGKVITLKDRVCLELNNNMITLNNHYFFVPESESATFLARNGGVTRLASGGYACVVVNGSALFDGGSFTSSGNQAILGNTGSNIELHHSIVTAGTRAILLYDNSNFVMTSGYVSGVTYGISANYSSIDLAISGGDIIATSTVNNAASAIYHPNAGSVLLTDSVHVIGKNTILMNTGTLTITGGNYEGSLYALNLGNYSSTNKDSILISGGVFNGNVAISSALQNKITLNGGIISGGYWKDLNPATPFNYLVEDRWTHFIVDKDSHYYHWYEVVENSMYMQSIASAPWQEATTWDSLIVPTRSSYLEIVNGYNVTVDASATNLDAAARRLIIDNGSLTVEGGTTLVVDTLKINDEGKLIIAPTAVVSVGVGGLNSPNADAVVVQADATGTGVLRFNPGATSNNHPLATVQMFLKSHKDGDTFRSQHVGEPLYGTITADNITRPAGTYVDTLWWKGWAAINSWSELRPFVGYAFSVNSATAPTSPYVFKGKVVGNMNATYKWQKGYYNLFGNSYTAPMSIRALLDALETAYEGDSSYPDNMGLADYAVWIYDMDARQHEAITKAEVATTDRYIAPMQGFILWCDSVMMPDRNYYRAFTLTYADAVWNIDEPNTIGVPITAPALRKELGDEEDDVWYEEPEPVVVDSSIIADIVITSATSHDKVTLREGEQYTSAYDNGADARKLMADAVFNVFGKNEDLALSHIATDNLNGTTLTLQARDEMTYTMSFGRVNNFDYAIRDVVTDQVIDVVEGNTYTFNVTPNTTAYDRFVLEAGDHKLPTGCEKVVTSKHIGVYTMLGQYLGTAEQLNNLPAGVYVVNGQRVVK